ncbi:hypothetical protein COCON_G00139540 [Conger conger]|uniref:Matrix remodeling-associated protein 8 n=1 Tax=Conger conger TaxID=82655 RepID=A0A9Q1DB13_CONCO|nr:hypothetical protein COCON_G00139540 [Conger conger]
MRMETATDSVVRLFLLFLISAATLFTNVLAQSRRTSVVVEARNISAPAGSRVVLQCQNPRMVLPAAQRKDRQRVLHWDLFHAGPEHSVERIVDMFSTGNQRLYNGLNKGRVSLSKTAFSNGNFSLTIRDVGMNDRGTYTCNLHHHYCNMQESMKVQLNVTKSPRKQKRFWDGDQMVFVALQGSTVVLPCVNRRAVWTDPSGAGEEQVARWDWQPPGVRREGADRLVDLYSSGEQRQYGPNFLRGRMNVSDRAFALGDFSLSVWDLRPADRGLYSCVLLHEYCGLHQRRVYRLIVEPAPNPHGPSDPPPRPPNAAHTDRVEVPHFINVIIPEQRGHFLQQLGYILATLLFLVLVAIVIILLIRRCKTTGTEYDLCKSQRGHMTDCSFEMGITDLRMSAQQDLKLDYKNNILKEKAEMSKLQSPNTIDLHKGNREMDRKTWK